MNVAKVWEEEEKVVVVVKSFTHFYSVVEKSCLVLSFLLLFSA